MPAQDVAMMELGHRFKLIPTSGAEPLYARTTEAVGELLRGHAGETFDVVTLDGTAHILVGDVVLEGKPEMEGIQVAHYRAIFPQAAHTSGIAWEIVKHFGPFEVALRSTGVERDGKGVHEYALWDHEWPEAKVFHGHDFLASPSKNDEAKAIGLLGILSMRLGDKDDEFFAPYTPAQVRWRDERAERAQTCHFEAKRS